MHSLAASTNSQASTDDGALYKRQKIALLLVIKCENDRACVIVQVQASEQRTHDHPSADSSLGSGPALDAGGCSLLHLSQLRIGKKPVRALNAGASGALA